MVGLRFHRSPVLFVLPLLSITAFVAGCNNDDKPGGGSGHVTVVNTVAELDDALTHSVAGDTIEIRGEFSSPTYVMTKGYTITDDRSPLTIVGNARSTFRPELVFPAGTVGGITFNGVSKASSIAHLDIRGGQDAIVISDSKVTLKDINFRNQSRYAVSVAGNLSDASVVDSCLIDHPGVFGVYDVGGADMTISHNTIVNAGDCGLFIGASPSIRNNNIWHAANQGIHCEGGTTPTILCNNVFESGNTNYVTPTDVSATNFSVDPSFCLGTLNPSESGPLGALFIGTCGGIGRFNVADCSAQ